jgi:hypothetical protein
MSAATMRPGLWGASTIDGSPGSVAGRRLYPLARRAVVVYNRAGLEAPAIAPSVAAFPG